MSTAAEPASSLQRDWWLRTLAILQSPRPVFAALRDDSREAAEAREEPLTAIIVLAGVALTVLSSTADSFADDPLRRGVVIPVWLLISGALVGAINYWLAGGVLYFSLRRLGGRGSYRRARHLLGLAAAPLALSLVLLPFRLSLYGGDIFRSGGSDAGSGQTIFLALGLAFGAWAAVLLAIGIRAVHGWTWARALAGLAIAVVIAVLLNAALAVLF